MGQDDGVGGGEVFVVPSNYGDWLSIAQVKGELGAKHVGALQLLLVTLGITRLLNSSID